MQFRENLNSLIVIITRNINVGERLTNGQHAIVQYLAKAKDGDGIDEADRTLESRSIAASEPPTP